jgi:small subunit ribosomal protein S6
LPKRLLCGIIAPLRSEGTGQGRVNADPVSGLCQVIPRSFCSWKITEPGANPKKGESAALYDYELALIVRPEIDEEGQAALIEQLSELLTSGGGEVTEVENWGRRRLAYPIRKTQEGFYYFIQGQFSASVLPELERTIKLNEDVLRHMVLRTDI